MCVYVYARHNAIIYFLKGDVSAVQFFETELFLNASRPCISSITALELLSYAPLPQSEEKAINDFLDIVSVVPVDIQIARIAGSLRRSYKIKSPDAAIAATALFTGTTIATRNVRDFRQIVDLNLKKI